MKTCIWPVIYVQGIFCDCTLGFLDRAIYRVWLYAARISSDGGIVVGSGSLGGVFDFASSEFDGRCLITCHLAWGGGWVFGGGFVAAGHAHRWGGDGVIGGSSCVFDVGGVITCHLAWGGGCVFGGGCVAAGHALRWGGDGVIVVFVFRLGVACGAHPRGHQFCDFLFDFFGAGRFVGVHARQQYGFAPCVVWLGAGVG